MNPLTPEGSSNDGLRFQGLLPLSVTPLAELPGEAELAALNGANEALLAGLRSLNEKPELEDADQLHAEVRRLDYKLSLVLDLLSLLLQRTQPLPPAQAIVLESHRLQLAGPLPAAPCYRIELYLETAIPKPLRLYARSIGAADEPGASASYSLEFIGVGQPVQDGLDRFLFRQHRRQVAQRLK